MVRPLWLLVAEFPVRRVRPSSNAASTEEDKMRGSNGTNLAGILKRLASRHCIGRLLACIAAASVLLAAGIAPATAAAGAALHIDSLGNYAR